MYKRLKILRKSKKFSQRDIAKMLYISQTTYSDYELGKINIPNEILIKLAIFFDTSTDYILGLTNEPKPPKDREDVILNEDE